MDEPEKNTARDPGGPTKADFDRDFANAIKGLPVAGYKATQPQPAIDAVNRLKHLEERVMREIDGLTTLNSGGLSPLLADQRLLAIGRTQLQGAFMFLARAVFQPGRVTLPEDGDQVENFK